MTVGKVATGKCGVVHDIKEVQQVGPLISREIFFVRMSASWFLDSTYLIWTLWVSNNQFRATLWVLETCLIVGLLPFDDHLYHSFVVFENIQL